jgi:site-specific DNA-methyltransferase (adenine-specific)
VPKYVHPTQKPLALVKYLVETYSSKGDTILDNASGSGTLAIAALDTDRNYICIEKDEHNHQISMQRVETYERISTETNIV